jgi:NADPH:quinone reductase-like Zn-dependent oxidoreductase
MHAPVPAMFSSTSAVIPQSPVRSLQEAVADQRKLCATMAPSNKIVKLDEFSMKDDLSHVQVVEAPVPEPKQGEVLVNAYLRPVNPTDVILIKTGWGGLVPLPSTPGSEGVGRVVKNGPGASKFKEGQRVAAAPWPQFQGRGSWAQYVAIPEKDLVSNKSLLQL